MFRHIMITRFGASYIIALDPDIEKERTKEQREFRVNFIEPLQRHHVFATSEWRMVLSGNLAGQADAARCGMGSGGANDGRFSHPGV